MKMLPEQLTGGMSLTDEQSEQVEGQMKHRSDHRFNDPPGTK